MPGGFFGSKAAIVNCEAMIEILARHLVHSFDRYEKKPLAPRVILLKLGMGKGMDYILITIMLLGRWGVGKEGGGS